MSRLIGTEKLKKRLAFPTKHLEVKQTTSLCLKYCCVKARTVRGNCKMTFLGECWRLQNLYNTIMGKFQFIDSEHHFKYKFTYCTSCIFNELWCILKSKAPTSACRGNRLELIVSASIWTGGVRIRCMLMRKQDYKNFWKVKCTQQHD